MSKHIFGQNEILHEQGEVKFHELNKSHEQKLFSLIDETYENLARTGHPEFLVRRKGSFDRIFDNSHYRIFGATNLDDELLSALLIDVNIKPEFMERYIEILKEGSQDKLAEQLLAQKPCEFSYAFTNPKHRGGGLMSTLANVVGPLEAKKLRFCSAVATAHPNNEKLYKSFKNFKKVGTGDVFGYQRNILSTDL